MKILQWVKGSRTDAEVAELISDLIGLVVIVFIISLFLLASGMVTN